MSLFPIYCIAFGFLALFWSKPLFIKSSFDWWSNKFWGRSESDYIYNRYNHGFESLSFAIITLSLGISLSLNLSDFSLMTVFFTEGIIILLFAIYMLLNKKMRDDVLTYIWSVDAKSDGLYLAYVLIGTGLLLIFTAYIFRPLDFYF
jgi:hypothetical protein